MNNLDHLYEMVGPNESILDLITFMMKINNECKYPQILFFDLDNVVFKTNQILTEKWLPKTFWRHFINNDVYKVDMDKFFFYPEKIGIPKGMITMFRLNILISVSSLTREMRKMHREGKQVAVAGMVGTIRRIREAGIQVIFLTNRPQNMWEETKKQVEIIFGKDDRNVIMHMKYKFKKADVVRELASYSIGLVDDKIHNLVDLCGEDYLAILFTNGEDSDIKNTPFVKIAKTPSKIVELVLGPTY